MHKSSLGAGLERAKGIEPSFPFWPPTRIPESLRIRLNTGFVLKWTCEDADGCY